VSYPPSTPNLACVDWVNLS